jgi:RNA polymerase sigma-70 factor (ECF subfamily)
MHDEALMIQWNRRGDSDAFRTIIQRYGNMVFATALRVLGNPADAEDVAQDCFEKLARTPKTPRGYLGPWLHRMAVNRALDHVRSESARKRRETVYENNKPSATELEWDDIYPLVDEAIDRLPEKLRRALVAHYLEGLTHDAIAQRESVTRAAITQRIQRALEQMRTSLQRKGVAVPGVAVLAGTLGGNLAEAAALPVSLTEKLGRIALAGPVVGKTGAAVGIATIAKVAVGGLAALVIAVGGIGLLSSLEPKSGSAVDLETAAAGTQLNVNQMPPAESESPPNQSPALVDAVTAALKSTAKGQTASVSGRVYDKVSGENVAGAEITCRVDQERYQAVSDEHGMYTLAPLKVGEVHITCRSANGYYMAHERYEGGPSPYHRTIKLSAGRHYEGIDFALEKGLSFAGRIVDSEGRAIGGATVSAYAEPNNFRIVNTAVSRSDGRFVVSGFPKTVELTLWADKEELVSELYGPFALPQSESVSPDVVLWLEAIVSGKLVDRAGLPVKGLRVVPQFHPHAAARGIESESDSEGHFDLKGMPPGIALLSVCRDVEIVADPCPTFTLTAGEVVKDVIIVCSVGDQYIAGTVVDQQGNPTSADVACVASDGTTISSRANGAGMFIVAGLEPGEYAVMAEDWGRHIGGGPVTARTGDSTVRIVLNDPIKVSGRVVDAKSGLPITDYEVKDCFAPWLITHDQRYERNQSPEGDFELNVTQTGDVRIAARADGYLLGYIDVHLMVGQKPLAGVEIRLHPQADLSGVVHDGAGQPVNGVLIFSGETQYSDAEDYASARTGEDGTFVLPASRLLGDVITVFHPDYPQTKFQLQKVHWNGQPIEIRLQSTCTLECTFLLDETPCNGASVSVLPDRENMDQTEGRAVTRQDGTCTIRALAPGGYRIGVTPFSQSPQMSATVASRVTLGEGETQSILMQFVTGTTVLKGVVKGSHTFMNLRLEVYLPQGTQHYFLQFDEGISSNTTFEFADLPAAPAVLLISWGVQGQPGRQVEHEMELQPGAVMVHDLDLEALAAEYIPGSTTR